MAGLLIVYGTTEGQTRKIAERMAEEARRRGHAVEVHDASALPADLDPGAFDAAVVAASVHQERHQTAIEHFVRRNVAALQGRPTAFVSVSLHAVGDAEDRRAARACADRFLAETGWPPARTHLVAGALRYTQYDFFKRWIMKRIAREKNMPTDTGRDHEYTDWDDLVRFIDGFLGGVGRAQPSTG